MRRIALSVAACGLLFGTAFSSAGSNGRLTSDSEARHSVMQEQTKPAPQANTYTGTIAKDGDAFVLRDDGSKVSYQLDDQKAAGKFAGKRVKVIGTLDADNNIIRVQSIVEVNA